MELKLRTPIARPIQQNSLRAMQVYSPVHRACPPQAVFGPPFTAG
jgi:hypothetical protein